jgi:hypothetical protein
MVQRIGAQYLVKRVTDYVMAPPAQAGEPANAETVAAAPAAESGPDLDGEEVRDDEGKRLGIARRLRDIAVYVVADGFGDRVETLQRCIEDPETRVLFHTVDGRLAGLIYVPDPSKAPARSGGMRADDV